MEIEIYFHLWYPLLFCCTLANAGIVERSAKKEVIVGAPASVNENDPAVLEASHFAVNSISEGSGSANKLGLFKVVSASRQVVSGALYTIKLQAARSDCSKAAPRPVCSVPADAADSTDPDFNECTVKVWDQPWLTPRFKITSLKCNRENANAT